MNRAEQEMVEGFRDGYDLTEPEPSHNRSRAYRHGFLNGRDDRAGNPRASAQTLREEADLIIAEEANAI